MRTLVKVFIVLLAYSQSWASTPAISVLQVYQVPPDGMLLDKGWMFRAGDQSEWAKPSSSDTGWQRINPAQDIMQLPQVRKAGIGWFRLRLHLGSQLQNQALTLLLTQSVASQIYLNGHLIHASGEVSADARAVKAAYSSLEPVALPVNGNPEQVLAVRVAFQPSIPYLKFGGVAYQNLCLQLHLIRQQDVSRSQIVRQLRQGSLIDSFRAGLFFLLAFLHLAFFLSYPIRKANLYFSATALCFALDALATAFINGQLIQEAAVLGWLEMLAAPFYPLGYFFLLSALYVVFDLRRPFFYPLLWGWFSITLILLFSSYQHGYNLMFLSTILLTLEAIRMTVMAVLRRQPGARIILAGMVYSFAAFLLVLVYPYMPASFPEVEGFVGFLVFNTAALSIPLSISLYLAIEFATTGKLLARRLQDVLELSELNRIQELEKRQLQEIDALKSRFFANLSHEFRTPLSLIRGTVEKLRRQKGPSDEQQTDYERIDRNAGKLLQMINQLLDLAKLKDGQLALQPRPDEVSRFLQQLAGSFVSTFESKGISFGFTTPLQPVWVDMDSDKLEQILSNLLTNAYKFTPSGGKVRFSAWVEAATSRRCLLKCTVQDTGIGIPSEHLSRIFDRFYQVDNSPTRTYEGTGIGLSLVKELVELHGGSIKVASTEGTGTSFNLQIPLTLSSPKAEAQVAREPVAQSGGPAEPPLVAEETIHVANGRTHILVVEDNLDLRQFLQSSLSQTYYVTEAGNGLEGYRKALEVLPDLILCDVMMPGMDGITLCQKLRTDHRTSHIPLILLTAKADSESKRSGLQTGADEYLTKPFSMEELLLRVNNLTEGRRKLKERFSKQITLQPTQVSLASPDEKFIQKALQVMEANLSNAAFDVEAFGREMGVGRTQLHNKLTALTGQSANEMIRTMRLKRAAYLLEQKPGNVSEVAYLVGFSSPNYFAKCFRDFYQKSPSQYARLHCTPDSKDQ